MSDEFLKEITGLVPLHIRNSEAKLWQEIIQGWQQYFDEYQIPQDKQREEFDSIMRVRMAFLVMSVAPPTDEEKSAMIQSEYRKRVSNGGSD